MLKFEETLSKYGKRERGNIVLYTKRFSKITGCNITSNKVLADVYYSRKFNKWITSLDSSTFKRKDDAVEYAMRKCEKYDKPQKKQKNKSFFKVRPKFFRTR